MYFNSKLNEIGFNPPPTYRSSLLTVQRDTLSKKWRRDP